MRRWEQVTEVLRARNGVAHLSKIYRGVEAITGESLSPGQEAGIRKVIEDYSSDSRNWRGGADLFRSVDGLGRGVWGLRTL